MTSAGRVRWKRGRWCEEIPGMPWRWLLVPAWCGFRTAVAVRSRLYDLGWKPALRLNVPVFSVGNLAAGGTGKTPVTRFLAETLLARGERPAVLMRGYRGDGVANDEAQLIGACPVVCDPDRVAGGHRAIADGATCLILDDGFQHRRLHRDLDVVLIDATRPFSGVLPLGYDREPRSALARADVLIITRGALIADSARARLIETLKRTGKPLLQLSETASWLTDLAGGNRQPVETLRDRAVLLASGLGNPRGFERAALRHGWQVQESWRYPDHHHFDGDDATELLLQAVQLGATLVMTAKDAVKLQPLLGTDAVALPAGTIQILHQRVAVAEADRAILAELIDTAITSRSCHNEQGNSRRDLS